MVWPTHATHAGHSVLLPLRPAVTSPQSNTPLKPKLMRHMDIYFPLRFYVFPHVISLDTGDIPVAWQRLSGIIKCLRFPHRCYFSAKGTEPNAKPQVTGVNEGLANSRQSSFKHWKAAPKRCAALQGCKLRILSLKEGKSQHWQRKEKTLRLPGSAQSRPDWGRPTECQQPETMQGSRKSVTCLKRNTISQLWENTPALLWLPKFYRNLLLGVGRYPAGIIWSSQNTT